MSGVPETVPNWATNAAFASPSDPWDTDPTKVEPPTGKKDEGWEPTEEPPAEFLNYWKNLVFRWIDQMKSVQIGTLIQNEDGRVLAQPAANPISLWYDGRFFYITGINFNGGILRSEDGIRDWRVPTTPAGVNTTNYVAGDGAGVVVGVNDGGEIVRSTDFGDTYVIAEAAGSITANNLTAITWDSSSSLFVITSTTDEIFTSPTGANGTWTSRTLPGGAAGLDGKFAEALTGAATGRVVMVNTAGAMYSDDNITWTQVNFTGGGANGGRCCGWTDAEGGYFLMGTADGEVWRAADATSWAMVQADVGPTIGGTANDTFGADMISDGGGAWAALFVATGAGAPDSYIYSFDGGVTWTSAPFGGTQFFSVILHAFGKFYFGAQGNQGQVYYTPTFLP